MYYLDSTKMDKCDGMLYITCLNQHKMHMCKRLLFWIFLLSDIHFNMTFEKKKIFILIITVAILTLRVNFTINKTNSFTSMLKPVFAMSKPNQIEAVNSFQSLIIPCNRRQCYCRIWCRKICPAWIWGLGIFKNL